MKLLEALQNARELLEANGYGPGGDIYDDLELAISRLQNKYPEACLEEF